MGNINQVNQLEAYIDELGTEISKVKKASEYLRLIEQLQIEIVSTSTSLIQTRDQLKISLEIMENKLDLYQSIIKSVEAKQQMSVQTQEKILSNLSEYKQHEDEKDNESKRIMNTISELVKKNNEDLMSNFNSIEEVLEEQTLSIKEIIEEQTLIMESIAKNNKLYFATTITLIVSIGGILIYLLGL